MKKQHIDLVVIGSGPGGYAAAFYAADLGKQVLLVEKVAILTHFTRKSCYFDAFSAKQLPF